MGDGYWPLLNLGVAPFGGAVSISAPEPDLTACKLLERSNQSGVL